jgi:hypothetical protein
MVESITGYSKQKLFQRLLNEWSNILQILNEMKSQEKEHHAIGNWTIYEMLSHLAGWAVWRVKATKELFKTGHSDYSHFSNTDEFNACIVAERVNQSWGQIVQEVKHADEEWIALLDSLSEEDIFVSTRFRSPAWETLAEWVKIAFEHYTHHARIIERYSEKFV